MDPPAIRRLEEIADRAWPARETARGEGWEARFSDGMHRRINSATVWESADLPGTVAQLEAWYEDRGLPPVFKLTRASAPGLDEYLKGLHYGTEAGVAIMTRPLGAHSPGAVAPGTETAEGPTDEWIDAYAAIAGYGPRRRHLLSNVLARIGPPAVFAAHRAAGDIVAVGMAVAEGGHAGVFEMATHPDHRGRGLATGVLATLVDWMHDRGASTAYLQVVESNDPAERLYRRAGFLPRYTYWYRTRPGGVSASSR